MTNRVTEVERAVNDVLARYELDFPPPHTDWREICDRDEPLGTRATSGLTALPEREYAHSCVLNPAARNKSNLPVQETVSAGMFKGVMWGLLIEAPFALWFVWRLFQ